jgi:hypothetical protein
MDSKGDSHERNNINYAEGYGLIRTTRQQTIVMAGVRWETSNYQALSASHNRCCRTLSREPQEK